MGLEEVQAYGEDVAILAGDALLSLSFEIIARATPKSVPAEKIVQVSNPPPPITGLLLWDPFNPSNATRP